VTGVSWLPVVRQAIQTIAPAFSARRMVKEYIKRTPSASGVHD
jgi:hypothetical protein